MRLLLAAIAVALAAAPTAAAAPGRLAVGVEASADVVRVEQAVRAVTGARVSRELAPLGALVLSVPDLDEARRLVRRLPGVGWVEPVGTRQAAFVPSDPLAANQWYLAPIRAFDAWAEPPALAPVLVAVIDSGIDAGHPEFAGRIEGVRSFVSTSGKIDTVGHGTMVAGEIAAALNNAEGIAGIAFPARLLVGKVVGTDGTISLEAEAKAIRWAVDMGARVINLSLGGQRDPRNSDRDTYSELVAAAIRYAAAHGVVVVAATGNCEAVCPYRYASYPAALPHVLGVAALSKEDTVPRFSNRDRVFIDLAAPGVGIVSTFPRDLGKKDCVPAGYTLCAPTEYERGEGTSFAAPIVTAAAALLISLRPDLDATQVFALLEGTAVDVESPGRDAKSGLGRLDVLAAVAALAGPLPPGDPFEITRSEELNDQAGNAAYALYFGGGTSRRVVKAVLDEADDPADVYRVFVRRGQTLALTFRATGDRFVVLQVFEPGTDSIDEGGSVRSHSIDDGRDRLTWTARRTGWHYVALRALAGGGAYSLAITRG